jgi:hypothetical protein
MEFASAPKAAPILVLITFALLLHSTVYGENIDAKRCPTENEYLNPGSYWTNCPLIQPDLESPPGHASVSDYVFVYLIRFDQIGAGRDQV